LARNCQKYDHLIGKKFKDNFTGKTYRLFGLVHGGDDYYYGFQNIHNHAILSSCVGRLEDSFKLIED
jgi:hypothetical protein